jgi:anti-sigma regulatory factor (Ser/Thr protein kinase)
MAISSRTIEVQHQAHVGLARRFAEELAMLLGFDEIGVGEIAIAVTELATNLVKHGTKKGRIISSHIERSGRVGIEIVSEDSGPGIADVEFAIEDGHSTHETMGSGLGAVNRLMDEFDITSKTADMKNNDPSEVGTRIVCRKWLPAKIMPGASAKERINFAVMSRPVSGEIYTGDAYFLKHYNNTHFIALIDGLGHGEKANVAAQTAIGFIKDNYKKGLKQIFDGVHRACGKTRGVVMSACRIDMVNKTFTYAGIGNVVARVFYSPKPVNPTNFNGTLGVVMKKVRAFEYPWEGGIIVMYTDGISGRWSPEDIPEMNSKASVEIAKAILDQFGRKTDDATVIVGK